MIFTYIYVNIYTYIHNYIHIKSSFFSPCFLLFSPFVATSEVQIQGAGHQLQTQGVGIQDTFASGKSWTVMDLYRPF